MDLPIDPAVAHHWFGTELNNFTWAALERGDRDRKSVELMVQAAHACHYHWSQVGTDLNRQRSYCLLASENDLALLDALYGLRPRTS